MPPTTSLSFTVFHRGALHSVTQPKRIRVNLSLPVSRPGSAGCRLLRRVRTARCCMFKEPMSQRRSACCSACLRHGSSIPITVRNATENGMQKSKSDRRSSRPDAKKPARGGLVGIGRCELPERISDQQGQADDEPEQPYPRQGAAPEAVHQNSSPFHTFTTRPNTSNALVCGMSNGSYIGL